MEEINKETAIDDLDNSLDSVGERYGIVSVASLDGLVMKFKLKPPTTGEIKPLPIIDVNCSEYGMRFPLIDEPKDSLESTFMDSTKIYDLEPTLLDEIDLQSTSNFPISNIVDETEIPTTGPEKRVQKRKFYCLCCGDKSQGVTTVSSTVPKDTRMMFPSIEQPEDKTENIEPPALDNNTFPISKTVDKSEISTTQRVRKRKLLEVVENNFGDDDESQDVRTESATLTKQVRVVAKKTTLKIRRKRKRWSKPKRKPKRAYPPGATDLYLPTTSCEEVSVNLTIANETVQEALSKSKQIRPFPIIDVNCSEYQIILPSIKDPENTTDNLKPHVLDKTYPNFPIFNIIVKTDILTTGQVKRVRKRKILEVMENNFGGEDESQLVRTASNKEPKYGQSVTKSATPKRSVTTFKIRRKQKRWSNPKRKLKTAYKLGATDLQLPTSTCQEVSVPPAMIQPLSDNTAIETTHKSLAKSEIETISTEENVINLDFHDPLDFELTEDITDMDLISIFDDNMDYCGKIYNCNPLYEYILMDSPRPNKPQEVIEEDMTLVPLNPVLTPHELDIFLSEQPLDSKEAVIECPNCLEHFTDYAKIMSHIEVTCKDRRAVKPA